MVIVGIIFVPPLIGRVPELIKRQTVELNLISQNIDINVGKTQKINYEFINLDGKAAPAITFESDNSFVAKVDESGTVTGISSGNTFITITYSNGRENVSKNINVTVKSSTNNDTSNNVNNNNTTNNSTVNNSNNTTNSSNSNNSNNKSSTTNIRDKRKSSIFG